MCLAVPGKVISVSGEEDPIDKKAKVSFGGVIKEVSLACVPDTKVGEYVIVHVGLAISKVDEKEAMKVFEYLEQIGELDEIRG